MRFSYDQLYNRIVNAATRKNGGLNKTDIQQIEKIYGPIQPLQTGGAMNEFTVFTLNIKMFEDANYDKLAEKIKSVNADIVFIQEDIIKTDAADYEWLNRGDEPRYQLMYQCESHRTYNKIGDRLANSIYKKTSMHGEFDLSQRYSYNVMEDITAAHGIPKRCAALSKFNNILMASVHLTGGRFEDMQFATLGPIKSKQLSILTALNVDLIAGDFNGDTNVGTQLDKYIVYSKLSPDDKKKFELYWTSGHDFLARYGYNRVNVDGVTSLFGTRSDHIYYKSSKLKLLNAKMINCFDVTDHNGIMAKFEIIDRTDRCNSIMSYDCIIYPDKFSEVILKKGSIIYRSSDMPCSQDHMFFAGIKTASIYSDSTKTLKGYIVRRNLRLLDLNNYVNIQNLINASKNEKEETRMAVQLYFVNGIREIGSKSYHTKTGHKKNVSDVNCDVVDRYTNQICTTGFITDQTKKDKYYLSRAVLKFVCTLGFDGTIHMGLLPRARSITANNVKIPKVSSAFHDEIGICSCSNDLELI